MSRRKTPPSSNTRVHGRGTPDEADNNHRRERELASLYAIARSLTALSDVNTVLSSIVKHAHDLMGSDLTYLSVLEGEELQLRAVEGAVSIEFRTARVRATTGIGGRVIQTSAPFWVKNYLEAVGFEHVTAFDELASTEGLVALLGVPLLVGRQVIGVLYAAERTERPYAPEEVALFSALADHASVALENARLYQESRSSLKDLQTAYVTIERSGQIHEALAEVVLKGGGEPEIASLLTESLAGRVTIVNRYDESVVSCGSVPGADLSSTEDWQGSLMTSRTTGRSVAILSEEGLWHLTTAIQSGPTYLGAVVWSTTDAPQEIDRRTVERAAQIVGLLALKQEAVLNAEERLRGEILSELMRSKRPLSTELIARGRALKLDVNQFTSVVTLLSTEVSARDIERHLRSFASIFGALVGDHLGYPTLVLHSDDLSNTVEQIHRRLRTSLRKPLIACGAPIDDDSGGFGSAFNFASRCLGILAATGVEDLATTTTENGVYAVLFDPDRAEELRLFLRSTLGQLKRYDEENRTSLISTLICFFNHAGNAARTARALHVHTNTLLKRLERVAAVLGPDWNNPERNLSLQLALRLHHLATVIHSE